MGGDVESTDADQIWATSISATNITSKTSNIMLYQENHIRTQQVHMSSVAGCICDNDVTSGKEEED